MSSKAMPQKQGQTTMTNVEQFLELATQRLLGARRAEKREDDPNLVKYDIECAMGYMTQAIRCIEDEDIIYVCQWCGEESDEDHINARCVKG